MQLCLFQKLMYMSFLRDKVKLPDNEAKHYAKEFIIAEEKLHNEIKNGISSQLENKQVATKTDIETLRTEMQKGFKETIIWVVGFMIAISSIALAIIKLF